MLYYDNNQTIGQTMTSMKVLSHTMLFIIVYPFSKIKVTPAM
jgi:hypothetical protein